MVVIGVDLGGTKSAVALFSTDGVLIHKQTAALASLSGEAVGQLIISQIQGLLDEASVQGLEVAAAGVSVPGIYYATSGCVWAPNVPGWVKYPLRSRLNEAFRSLQIRIDSDRAAYILGEVWQGCARGCQNAIFLAIGTGIGAGILIDGKILRGAQDIAGAVGWMGLQQPFHAEYATCGAFEYYASGEGLARLARHYLIQDPTYQGPLRAKPVSVISSYDLFDLLDQEDELVKKVFGQAVQLWGMAAANLISTFNPQKLIFGGGVFGPASRFIDAIRGVAGQWAQPISMKHCAIDISTIGSDAGLIGAAKIGLSALE